MGRGRGVDLIVSDLAPIGRILLVVGVVIAVIGAALAFGWRIPLLGQLPGDISIDRDNVRVFIPLGTMLLLSIVLTIILNLLGRSQ